MLAAAGDGFWNGFGLIRACGRCSIIHRFPGYASKRGLTGLTTFLSEKLVESLLWDLIGMTEHRTNKSLFGRCRNGKRPVSCRRESRHLDTESGGGHLGPFTNAENLDTACRFQPVSEPEFSEIAELVWKMFAQTVRLHGANE